jgi:hypothetical protein
LQKPEPKDTPEFSEGQILCIPDVPASTEPALINIKLFLKFLADFDSCFFSRGLTSIINLDATGIVFAAQHAYESMKPTLRDGAASDHYRFNLSLNGISKGIGTSSTFITR